MSNILLLNNENFNETLANNTAILVDFWAEWCGPCRKIAPILEELSNETGLPVGKLNIDENPEKSSEHSIHSIPTMVLFVDGNPVHRIVGAKPKHALLKELSQWI